MQSYIDGRIDDVYRWTCVSMNDCLPFISGLITTENEDVLDKSNRITVVTDFSDPALLVIVDFAIPGPPHSVARSVRVTP